MKSVVVACAFAFVFASATSPVAQQTSERPGACIGVNRLTGKVVAVRFVDRPNRFGGFHGQSMWDTAGNPIVFLNGEYFGENQTVRDFIKRHECCHHESLRNVYTKDSSTHAARVWYPDEVEANCCALAALDAHDVAAVGTWLSGIPVLPPQYGGNGRAFWSATRERCPLGTDRK